MKVDFLRYEKLGYFHLSGMWNICQIVNHIWALWLLKFSLCSSFFQREAAYFWDACWFDLVDLLWDGSCLNKKRKEGKRPLFFNSQTFFFILIKIQFKVNESRYIALFAFSYNLSKSFSQLIVSTLPVGKRLGLPYIAYIVIH